MIRSSFQLILLLLAILKIGSFQMSRVPTRTRQGFILLATDPVQLSELQIAALRKEAAQRQANNNLATEFLEESDDVVSSATISRICEQLRQHELCQVRGISKDDKKSVRAVAEALSLKLAIEMEKDVNLVQVKGHAGIYYTAAADEPKITLFTSVGQKNQWTKKPKATRDQRGQIIQGQYD